MRATAHRMDTDADIEASGILDLISLEPDVEGQLHPFGTGHRHAEAFPEATTLRGAQRAGP